MTPYLRSALFGAALFAASGSRLVLAQAPAPASAPAPVRLIVESPRMKTGEPMHKDFTPDGRNVSPAVTWSQAPAATKSFAVICADFGAGVPPPWVHWIIYNIPGSATGLPEGVPIDPAAVMPAAIAGATQGLNGWKRALYRGPAPPVGTTHVYYFTVYALDTDLKLKSNLTRGELLEAMKGHIIGQGDIVPVYERRAPRTGQ